MDTCETTLRDAASRLPGPSGEATARALRDAVNAVPRREPRRQGRLAAWWPAAAAVAACAAAVAGIVWTGARPAPSAPDAGRTVAVAPPVRPARERFLGWTATLVRPGPGLGGPAGRTVSGRALAGRPVILWVVPSPCRSCADDLRLLHRYRADLERTGVTLVAVLGDGGREASVPRWLAASDVPVLAGMSPLVAPTVAGEPATVAVGRDGATGTVIIGCHRAGSSRRRLGVPAVGGRPPELARRGAGARRRPRGTPGRVHRPRRSAGARDGRRRLGE